MSKAKKNAYAEKEKAAAALAANARLLAVGDAAPPTAAKKVKPRKQSRGK